MNISGVNSFNNLTVWKSENVKNQEAIEFLNLYDLPLNCEISLDESTGQTTLTWKEPEAIKALQNKYPEPLHQDDWLLCQPQVIRFFLASNKEHSFETAYFGPTIAHSGYLNFIIQPGKILQGEHELTLVKNRAFNAENTHENHLKYGCLSIDTK